MLPKSQRLNLANPENQDFYRAFRVITEPNLKVYWHKISSDNTSHQAVVVGKKVSLLAVVRNKLKRQVYQLLEKFLQDKPLLLYDLVVVVTRKSERSDYQTDLAHALAQLA